MFWKQLWEFLKSVWKKVLHRKTSAKENTTLDTVSVSIFGLDLKVTREVPTTVPYELTVVVPRAELRANASTGDLEVIVSSVTVAHSPRFEGERPINAPAPKPATIPVKPMVST
jgi:hypothetical protein